MSSSRAFSLGWAVYALAWITLISINLLLAGSSGSSSLSWVVALGFPILLIYSAVLFFLAWLLLGLPICRFVPDSSVFWSKPVKTTVGAALGLAISIVPRILESSEGPAYPTPLPLILILEGAIPFGFTFYFLQPRRENERSSRIWTFGIKSPLARTALFIGIFATVLFLFSGITAYMAGGISREGNSVFVFALVTLVCFAASWLAAAAFLIRSGIAFFRRNRTNGLMFLSSALIVAVLPFIGRLLGIYTTTLAEQSDLRMHDLNMLRSEVSELIQASKSKQYSMRWFGYEVPTTDLPYGIAALSEKAAYVTISDAGATIVTDGIASWRGGYLIQPLGVTTAPNEARQVADGIYYVISSSNE